MRSSARGSWAAQVGEDDASGQTLEQATRLQTLPYSEETT